MCLVSFFNIEIHSYQIFEKLFFFQGFLDFASIHYFIFTVYLHSYTEKLTIHYGYSPRHYLSNQIWRSFKMC